MSAVVAIAGYALRESLRRRVFAVVLVLTAGFLALYGLGASAAFHETDQIGSVGELDPQALTGATLLGLAMFATLFLGTVLAVFLTLGAVRGDAGRGLLQPLVARPLGRAQLLLGRFAGAALVCALYVALLYAASVVITGTVGGWWPDRTVWPGGGLGAGGGGPARRCGRGSGLVGGSLSGRRCRFSGPCTFRRPRTGSPFSWCSAR